MTFNEWMIHIHRQLGYPEEKLKLYEQGSNANIQTDKRCSLEVRLNVRTRTKDNYRVPEKD